MRAKYNVGFDHEFQYRVIPGLGLRPAVLVGLIGPTGQEDAPAIIDSGADYSLFNGRRAQALGLNLSSGKPKRLSGLAGSLQVRLLRLTLEILDSKFDCEVAFSEQDNSRELLGRNDLFDHVRLGFLYGSSLGYFHPSP